MKQKIECFNPHEFRAEDHWYPKALNASVNPMVAYFFTLSNDRIATRYCHMNPNTDKAVLQSLLSYTPKYFYWSGGDLINTTNTEGRRNMVVIETNSCPSGQKSTPLINEFAEMGGYERLINGGVKEFLKGKRQIPGVLAVFYDKNYMETSGYAKAMATAFKEPVYLVPYFQDKEEREHIRFKDGCYQILVSGEWLPVRFAFKYVTQKPWNRISSQSKTHVFNPIIVCLAGGRNKLLAAKAYEFFNASIKESGLKIKTPVTRWEVAKGEIPFWFSRFGGQMVVKSPYGNAGQGVYILTSQSQLDAFMEGDFEYDRFIVQSLIGNKNWSSQTETGKLYHVGTIPNKANETYVADIRFMIHRTAEGFRPLGLYSRKSRTPLPEYLQESDSPWDILGTNISVKKGQDKWDYDVARLIMMDRKDFNQLGLGIDDLIEGYVQTIMSTIAIDKLAVKLSNKSGRLKRKLFHSLNNDKVLLDEIMRHDG